jgi:HD-like signal output (HDOD) protein/ActR/RegA family two-component response regulator
MNVQSHEGSRRALVVDDEVGIRRLLVTALSKEGFQCDTASDGESAANNLLKSRYQLVVTDLAMPRRNGHSLIVDVLAMPDRPAIVAVTGILEPRLAKDLMARGVDDIVFKPLEFLPFAAKMAALVDRRKQNETSQSSTPPALDCPARPLPRVTSDEIRAKLHELNTLPPVSRAALDVSKLASNPEADVAKLAAAVQREPALVVQVLRFANTTFCNPSNQRVTDIDTAVVRLGQKRVGELAVSVAIASTAARDTISCIPLEPIWQTSLAAGICMEMLLDRSPQAGLPEELFVTALLQPMGRIVLAKMFPVIYERMLQHCREDKRSLLEVEQRVFADSVGAIAANALAQWGVPEDICRPLKYTSRPFHALGELPNAMRQCVECVKTATFIGNLAVGKFESWDFIDIPPADVLNRLGVLASDVDQCRHDLEALANWSAAPAAEQSEGRITQLPSPTRSAIYKRLDVAPFDCLAHLLKDINFRVADSANPDPEVGGDVFVNCLGVSIEDLVSHLESAMPGQLVLIADIHQATRLRPYGRVVTMPCSYGSLLRECLGAH